MKIGLLISDDPDDYQLFYEALEEIAKDTILVNIGVNSSASRYLKEAAKPDFIIIDVSMNEQESNEILRAIGNDQRLRAIPKLALVEDRPLPVDSIAGYIAKGTDYAELKTLLRRFLSD